MNKTTSMGTSPDEPARRSFVRTAAGAGLAAVAGGSAAAAAGPPPRSPPASPSPACPSATTPPPLTSSGTRRAPRRGGTGTLRRWCWTPTAARSRRPTVSPAPPAAAASRRSPRRCTPWAWTSAHSPLILGNDLRRLDDWTLRLVTNPEVLALLRVPGAREWHSVAQGHRFVCNGPQGTWAAWLNTSDAPWQVPLPARLPDASRDCWARADLPAGTRQLTIPTHGARLVRRA